MSESVFLSPKSIAIIGASDKRGSVGRTITSNIMNGFKGTVYPISPSRPEVFYKKAYKSVPSRRRRAPVSRRWTWHRRPS